MDDDSITDCSDSENIFGDPKIIPRVGDQYQAHIPTLIIDLCYQETDSSNHYSIGLPVPIKWDSLNGEKTEKESEKKALPILPCRPWKDIEYESFLVGLYVFGKNLNSVKKFVNSKGMGEILGYYYGKFYRSSDYSRCFKGKKMKIKSCIRGERIFGSWRRKELLSRLFSSASEESRGLLREINTKYEEDKVSLEKYVFTLRRIAGLKTLMEAISIGKGKRDLTRTVDPKKTQSLPPHIHKIRKGKKFASLTPREIVQFLTKIPLSKSWLNDLFWEAVWPRLLANGWRSEQPKYLAIFNDKKNLVFIVPGVGKFSRRSLIKGHQYFDSVQEVLDRVASDPSILTLKTDEKSEIEEKEMDYEKIQDRNGNVPKFTIVDTSLRYGKERSKVVEMRTLPDEIDYDILMDTRSPSEAEQETSEDAMYESDTRDCSTEQASIQENDADSVDVSGFQTGTESVDGEMNGDDSQRDISLATYENTESQEGPSENVSSDASLAGENPDGFDDEVALNEQKSRALIDLNLPPLTQELERNGTSVRNMVNDHEDSDTTTSSKVAPSQANEQFSDALNGRRQSTRNRPLTAKALEAIAYGFPSPTKKRKNPERRDNCMPPRAKLIKISDSSSEDNDADSK